jgi:ribosome-binding protein aMBF1 (putative translation factor)
MTGTSTEIVDNGEKIDHKDRMATLTPAQCRAARAWLDWSQEELAAKASLSPSTVRDFEKGRRVPIGNNMAALVAALRHAGVTATFDDNGQPLGVSARLEAAD